MVEGLGLGAGFIVLSSCFHPGRIVGGIKKNIRPSIRAGWKQDESTMKQEQDEIHFYLPLKGKFLFIK
jgi:hypothetical protein